MLNVTLSSLEEQLGARDCLVLLLPGHILCGCGKQVPAEWVHKRTVYYSVLYRWRTWRPCQTT